VFTPLDLVSALHEYNQKYHITERKYVAPTFREIRHIFNTAQGNNSLIREAYRLKKSNSFAIAVHAISKQLQLITFDADGTLYEDGGILSQVWSTFTFSSQSTLLTVLKG